MFQLREQPCDVSVAVVFLRRLIHTLWKKHNLQSAWIPLAVDFLLTYGLRGSRLVKRDCTIQLVLVLTLLLLAFLLNEPKPSSVGVICEYTEAESTDSEEGEKYVKFRGVGGV